MTPFSGSGMNRVDDENLCTGSTGQLLNGLVETAFYREMECKG
jgi:hypothetical protein